MVNVSRLVVPEVASSPVRSRGATVGFVVVHGGGGSDQEVRRRVASGGGMEDGID